MSTILITADVTADEFDALMEKRRGHLRAIRAAHAALDARDLAACHRAQTLMSERHDDYWAAIAAHCAELPEAAAAEQALHTRISFAIQSADAAEHRLAAAA